MLNVYNGSTDNESQFEGLRDYHYPPALKRFKQSGADVQGQRVRFPKGLCCKIIQDSAPRTFMLGAAEVYARDNQASIISPFILSGAMSPVISRRNLTRLLMKRCWNSSPSARPLSRTPTYRATVIVGDGLKRRPATTDWHVTALHE